MTKAKDPTIKLSEKGELTKLLYRTTVPSAISADAAVHLSKAPTLEPAFVEAQAKKFDVPEKRVAEIAQTVMRDEGPPMTLEKREISVEGEVKEIFRDEYHKEIVRRATCPYIVRSSYTGVSGKESSTWEKCGEKLESIQQALVHQSLHIMYDSGDPRTQRAMLNDIRELLYPVVEKSFRAILGPDERREKWEALERHRARRGPD